MCKTQLTVPCQWDIDKIKKIILNFSNGDIAITEMYGALSNGKTPQGRALSEAHHSGRDQALEVKKFLDSKGIKFAYLINTPVEMEKYQDLEDELDWIINVFQADSLTVSSKELMKIIRNQFPTIKINISTIAGIKSIDEISEFLGYYPNKVIAHHDLNRNFCDLKKTVDYLKQKKINFELMVNESCLRRCHYRDEHYRVLGEGQGDREFHKICNTIKVTNPYQLLMANFIRPEDLKLYEDMGITQFKITGRSKPTEWLEEVVQAYAERKYSGNLCRLLGTDPLLEVEQKIYIKNEALEGFMKEYPKNGNSETEIEYCEKWILCLYEKQEFVIKNIEVEPYLFKNKLRFHLKRNIY